MFFAIIWLLDQLEPYNLVQTWIWSLWSKIIDLPEIPAIWGPPNMRWMNMVTKIFMFFFGNFTKNDGYGVPRWQKFLSDHIFVISIIQSTSWSSFKILSIFYKKIRKKEKNDFQKKKKKMNIFLPKCFLNVCLLCAYTIFLLENFINIIFRPLRIF